TVGYSEIAINGSALLGRFSLGLGECQSAAAIRNEPMDETRSMRKPLYDGKARHVGIESNSFNRRSGGSDKRAEKSYRAADVKKQASGISFRPLDNGARNLGLIALPIFVGELARYTHYLSVDPIRNAPTNCGEMPVNGARNVPKPFTALNARQMANSPRG